jgi:gluconate 2-dehydrogenase alpha chain
MSNKDVDAVIVGGGWVGGIMGAELSKAGLTVVCLERGGDNRNTQEWAKPGMHDEVKYALRLGLMQDAAQETWTMRHNLRESATPIRYMASFLPGTGVGGAGVHWNGQTWRFTELVLVIRSQTEQR